MEKIITKYFALNTAKITNGFSIFLILYINFLILSTFAQFISLKLNLKNPLIPQEFISDLFTPYADVGFVLSTGLMLILILKFFKQNLIVIIGALILIGIYYLTDFSPE